MDKLQQNLELIDWQDVQQKLEAPFEIDDLSFRVLQKRGSDYDVAVYVTKAAVISRLNQAVGPQNWAYKFTPLVTMGVPQRVSEWNAESGKMEPTIQIIDEVIRAKGELSLFGLAPKEAVGDSSNISPTKGCDSDTLKRTAIMWGIGVYLYNITGLKVPYSHVAYSRITDGAIENLKKKVALITGQDYTPKSAGTAAPNTAKHPQTNSYKPKTVETPGAVSTAKPPKEPVSSPVESTQPSTPKPARAVLSPAEQELRTTAMGEYSAAIKFMGLGPGAADKALRLNNISAYLELDAVVDSINDLSIEQLTKATKGITDGEIVW